MQRWICHAELIPIDSFLCNHSNRSVYKGRGCWLSAGKHRYMLEKAESLEAHQNHPVPSTFPKHRPEEGGRKLKLHCQENPIPTVHKAGTALHFLRSMNPRDEKLRAGDSLYQLEQPQDSTLQAQHVLNSGKCCSDKAAAADLEHRDLGEGTFLLLPLLSTYTHPNCGSQEQKAFIRGLSERWHQENRVVL